MTQRLGELWDVRASVGRHRVNYLVAPFSGIGTAVDSSKEMLADYGVGTGYRIGRSRVVFSMLYTGRQSEAAFHAYNRLRVGTSLVYAFE